MTPLRLSLVTPSFQMARFLPATIDSVLAQGVADLDYFVADGGSTDGTLDILDHYSAHLRYRSAPDAGCAAALRDAFANASGDILGWLAADDLLLPGALHAALDAFRRHPEAVAVFSGGGWIDEHGQPIRDYPVVAAAAARLNQECLICQPACFFRASAYRAAGGLDASLTSAFDYDLWIRLSRLGPFVHQPGAWALARMHRANISLRQRSAMFDEAIALLHRHYRYVPVNWLYCRRLFLRDGRDQFFDPPIHSAPAYLAALPEGLALNRSAPLRFLIEWARRFPWHALRPAPLPP